MKNKKIITKIIQFLVFSTTVFIILKFCQCGTISYNAKSYATIALLTANAVCSYVFGMIEGMEIGDAYKRCEENLKAEAFNKIVDMIVEEKKNDRAVD